MLLLCYFKEEDVLIMIQMMSRNIRDDMLVLDSKQMKDKEKVQETDSDRQKQT